MIFFNQMRLTSQERSRSVKEGGLINDLEKLAAGGALNLGHSTFE